MKTKLLFIIIFIIGIISIISFLMIQEKDNAVEPFLPSTNEPTSSLEEEQEEETTKSVDGSVPRKQLLTVLKETVVEVFNREMNIVAIGDSLTHGVGDSSGNGGYVGILERSINQDREVAEFKSFGVPGNRSDQLLKRIDQVEIQEAISEADLILITIGANDIMQVAKENITNLQLDDFIAERKLYEERLGKTLDKIHKINANAEIYLLGIYNPFEKYFDDIVELNMITKAWNDTGQSIAQEKERVTFIPIIDLFTDKEENLFADDNFHPNYNGYYLISKRVLEFISNQEG